MTKVERLEEKIQLSGLRKNHIASVLGLTPAGFWKKVTGRSEFKASEIIELQQLLNLSPDETQDIFFSPDVE